MSSSLDIISSRELPEYDDLCCFRCQGAQAGHAAAAASGSDQHETSSDDNRTWCTFFEYSAQSVSVHGWGTIDETSCRCFFYDAITAVF